MNITKELFIDALDAAVCYAETHNIKSINMWDEYEDIYKRYNKR